MSKQLLILSSDSEYSQVLRLNLLKHLAVEVVDMTSLEDGIAFLDILPTINMVIIKTPGFSEYQVGEFITYLQEKEIVAPVLVLGPMVLPVPSNVKFERNTKDFKNLANKIGSTIGEEINRLDFQSLSEFQSIPVDFFLNINSSSLGCDVYIRIKKAENDFQFVKRLHSNDQFTRADIEKYRQSGLKEFYITKNHFPDFVNYVTDQLIQKLSSDKITGLERLKLSVEVFEVTKERIRILGVDEYTKSLVDESIHSMMKSLSEKNSLASLYQLVRSNQLSYSYTHSYVIALLLHKVIESFDWKSPMIKERLSYVAYFHDISLSHDQHMMISNMDELKKLALTNSDEELVLKHALKSAEILEKFDELPAGISNIVKEHHGAKNGVGFSEDLSISLSPLSMVFMVVEDFVNKFLAIKHDPSMNDLNLIFDQLREKYKKSTYKEAFVALESMTTKAK